MNYTVIRFLGVSAKFGSCTVVSVNGTPVEAKLCTFTLECTHFIFDLCPIYTHDGASAKFSTNSEETDYSVHCYPFRVRGAIFGTCTVVSVNGTLVESKMCTFTLESTHFIFNKCPI